VKLAICYWSHYSVLTWALSLASWASNPSALLWACIALCRVFSRSDAMTSISTTRDCLSFSALQIQIWQWMTLRNHQSFLFSVGGGRRGELHHHWSVGFNSPQTYRPHEQHRKWATTYRLQWYKIWVVSSSNHEKIISILFLAICFVGKCSGGTDQLCQPCNDD